MQTQATIAELNSQFEFRLIDLDLLDDPQAPERETMDDLALVELAESIASVGLIKPLIVLPRGKRYEVDAGHRRLIACRIKNYSPVPCRVKINDRVSALSIMVHENAHTEPVNPVEEARFYLKYLVEECGNDVDVLAERLRRRRDFVEDRLILLNGYDRVTVALEKSQISMGVAQQLNRLKDPNQMLLLLDQAINQGATVRTVTQWVRDANLQDPILLPADDGTDSHGAPIAPAIVHQPKCFFCGTSKHAHTLRFVQMHEPCIDLVRGALHLPDPDEPEAAQG